MSKEEALTIFGQWLSRFTATTLGVIVGGIILLLVARLYVKESAAAYLNETQRPAKPK